MDIGIWTVIITVIGTNLATIIAGVVTIWAGRKKASAEVQTVINTGFTDLIETLRDQVKYQSERMDQMEGELRRHKKSIVVLTRYILDKGFDLPPMEH
jgi:glutamate racemase